MKSIRNIPFGYMMRGGIYLAEPTESEAVRQIFRMYLNGMSLKGIAAEMTVPYNADKILWNKNMVSRILENKRYVGDDTYPQIVEITIFERVNAIKAEKAKTALPVDSDIKYVRGLIKYTNNTECIQLNVSAIKALTVSAINILIADPRLAVPADSPDYKPSAKLTITEEKIKEQMSDPAADADKLLTDILRAATMRYNCIKYDDRDKTEQLLDILIHHEKIEDFDIELTPKVIKYISVDCGKIYVELVNGKKLPIKGA